MALTIDGEALRDARLRRGESQKSLADKAGVVVNTVSNIETGHPARVTTIRRLAAALGVTVEDLLRRNDEVA